MSTPLTNYAEVSIPTVDDDEDTWGGINNGVHQLWDRVLGGVTSISTVGGIVELTTTQAQSGYIIVSGALDLDAQIVIPAGSYRLYRVRNFTTGNSAVTFRTNGGGDEVTVPQTSNMMLMVLNNSVQALSPPVNFNGGFRSEIKHPGKSYTGPGMFFMDMVAGFARRAAGVIGITLDDAQAGDQIRLHGTNSAAQPLIGMAPTGDGPWDSGFIAALDGGVRSMQVVTNGGVRGRFRQGFVLGSPTGGDQGVGAVNVTVGYFVNGVRVPVPVELPPVEIASAIAINHNLGDKPRYVDMWLRCQIAELGWAAGDDVRLEAWQTGSDADNGLNIWRNGTQVGAAIKSLKMMSKTGGGPNEFTASRWRVVFAVAR